MDEGQIAELLGLVTDKSHGHVDMSGEVSSSPTVRFHSLADPRATDKLGQLLAQRLKDRDISRVLVWADFDEAVLGFVVGRELECKVTRAWGSEGLLEIAEPIATGERVVVVTAVLQDEGPVQALASLIAMHKATLVAVLALLETVRVRTNEGGTLPIVSLRTGLVSEQLDS